MPKPRSQNKNLNPNPTALGVIPLAPGEATSKPLRVRGNIAHVRWFERLDTLERAQAIALAYDARHLIRFSDSV